MGGYVHVNMNIIADTTVLILSSNVARPAHLGTNLIALANNHPVEMIPFEINERTNINENFQSYVGDFEMKRLKQRVSIEQFGNRLVFVADQTQTAFANTTDGAFYLPIYDWLCAFSAYNTEFSCSARTIGAEDRYLFERQ